MLDCNTCNNLTLYKQMINTKSVSDSNTWNHITARKQVTSHSFKNNVTHKLLPYKTHTHTRTHTHTHTHVYIYIYIYAFCFLKKLPMPNINCSDVLTSPSNFFLNFQSRYFLITFRIWFLPSRKILVCVGCIACWGVINNPKRCIPRMKPNCILYRSQIGINWHTGDWTPIACGRKWRASRKYE